MSDTSSARARGLLPRRDLLVKGGAAAAAAAVGATVVGAGTASAAPLAPLLLPYGPERIYDSREASGRLNSGITRILSGDPIAGDLAYLLNVTVTDTIGQGFVSVFSADDVWPGNSTVNWSAPGQSIANTAYTLIRASDRGIAVRAGGPGSTQFVLDLTGILVLADLAAFNPTAIASNGPLATPQGSSRALSEGAAG